MSILFRNFFLISIHALREEGDCILAAIVFLGDLISIHALREEGDAKATTRVTAAVVISIHALREEGDKTPVTYEDLMYNFYPRPP